MKYGMNVIDAAVLIIALISAVIFPAILVAEPADISSNSSTKKETIYVNETSPDTVRAELANLQSELVNLESQYNAYDPAIAEISMDIADRLSERGQLVDANVAYRRALHVTRINSGLDSDRQIPILERIISNHDKLGEHEEVSSILDRLTSVYINAYGEMSPEIISHLQTRGDWHLSTSYYSPGSKELTHLLEAHSAYEHIRTIRETENLGYDSSLYSHLSAVNYAMVEYVRAIQAGGMQTTGLQMTSTGFNETNLRTQTLVDFAISSYRRGKRQLEQGLHKAKESLNPEEEITALLQLADWEQLFGKKFSARERYIEAHTKTSALPVEHELARAFDKPRMLPLVDISSLIPHPQERETVSIHLTMDISAWGISRNVQLTSSENTNDSVRARRRALSVADGAIYRPVIINGAPVSADGVSQTLIVSI